MPRDSLVGLIETMCQGAEANLLRPFQYIGSKDPRCLENPRPAGAELYTAGERSLSISR